MLAHKVADKHYNEREYGLIINTFYDSKTIATPDDFSAAGRLCCHSPWVSTFLGAILENMASRLDLKNLRKNINPFSKYRLGITDKELTTASKWNIK